MTEPTINIQLKLSIRKIQRDDCIDDEQYLFLKDVQDNIFEAFYDGEARLLTEAYESMDMRGCEDNPKYDMDSVIVQHKHLLSNEHEGFLTDIDIDGCFGEWTEPLRWCYMAEIEIG